MKNSENDKMYKEFLKFKLTDIERPYFGLEPINKYWEAVEIKEGIIVYYEGNTIKKVISFSNSWRYVYREFDTEIKTHERKAILPKTAKGKEKKITPSNLLSIIPAGSEIVIMPKMKSWDSVIIARCIRNNIYLPITQYEGIETVNQLKDWLKWYIVTCPKDYFEKVNRMKSLPHRTIKYSVGDIFRFEIDREYYGFGIIIGKLLDLRKQGVFPEGHLMNDVMTVPIFIRFYKFKTVNRDTAIQEVIKNELLPTEIVADNDIIWGSHEIVGNKKLEEKDIDFPMQFGWPTSNPNERGSFKINFCWGIGMKSKSLNSFNDVPQNLVNKIKFNNVGVALSIPIYKVDKVLNGESEFNKYNDLRHPENFNEKGVIFDYMELPINMDMDTFNEKNNGMTRRDYIDFVYSSDRKGKK
jgi:hypothetical protein